MAYVAPPTFATDDILTATNLNTLSGNQEYFKGIVDAPNVPFQTVSTPSAGVDAPTTDFYFRHTLSYFHWYFYLYSDQIDKVQIDIYDAGANLMFGGHVMYDDSTPASQAAALALDPSYRDSYDVSALTIGDWYRAEVVIEASGSGSCKLIYMEERFTA